MIEKDERCENHQHCGLKTRKLIHFHVRETMKHFGECPTINTSISLGWDSRLWRLILGEVLEIESRNYVIWSGEADASYIRVSFYIGRSGCVFSWSVYDVCFALNVLVLNWILYVFNAIQTAINTAQTNNVNPILIVEKQQLAMTVYSAPSLTVLALSGRDVKFVQGCTTVQQICFFRQLYINFLIIKNCCFLFESSWYNSISLSLLQQFLLHI